jgi:hypothetical protein
MSGRRTVQAAFSMFSFQDIITSVIGIMILVLLVVALELSQRSLQSPVVQHATTRKQTRATLEDAVRRVQQLRQALQAGELGELAGISAAEIRRETDELDRLIPLLESDLAAAKSRGKQLSETRQQAENHLAAREADRQELDQLEEELRLLMEELGRVKAANLLFFRPGPSTGKQAWLVQISKERIWAAPLGPESKPLRFEGATANSRQRQFLAWAAGRSPASDYFVLMIQPGGAGVSKEIEESLRERGFGVGLDLLGAEQNAIDPQRGAPAESSAPGGRG